MLFADLTKSDLLDLNILNKNFNQTLRVQPRKDN
jgi:hypothetical protein